MHSFSAQNTTILANIARFCQNQAKIAENPGWAPCLAHAYFLAKSQVGHAYKRHAYKIKMYIGKYHMSICFKRIHFVLYMLFLNPSTTRPKLNEKVTTGGGNHLRIFLQVIKKYMHANSSSYKYLKTTGYCAVITFYQI